MELEEGGAELVAVGATVECGDASATCWPVAVRRPLARSMRKLVTVPEFWFAANSTVPAGSIAKLRGVIPPVSVCPMSVIIPLVWLIENPTIESCPRLLP